MIYDVVEQAYDIANVNFVADHTALLGAKSIAPWAGTLTIIKRQRAETSREFGTTPPTLGVCGVRASTQAKDQGKRDTRSAVVYDLFARGTDPGLLAAQVELGAEALLRSIDRLAGSGRGVFGAGELPNSVSVEMSDGYDQDVGLQWWHRAEVTFPCHDRDEGV